VILVILEKIYFT